jgi:hypothetical protein
MRPYHPPTCKQAGVLRVQNNIAVREKSALLLRQPCTQAPLDLDRCHKALANKPTHNLTTAGTEQHKWAQAGRHERRAQNPMPCTTHSTTAAQSAMLNSCTT